MYKKISILIVVTIISAVFWLLAKPWIMNPSLTLSNVGVWLYPVISLIVLSAVLSLAFAMLENYYWRAFASVLSGLAFLAIFGLSPLYLAGSAILVIFHLIAIARISDELHARVKINGGAIIHKGLKLTLLPFLILISFVYFQTPSVQEIGETSRLPESIESIVKEASLRILTPQEAVYINEAIDRINLFIKPYTKYVPPILAFALFLALQGVSFIFVILATLLARLAFKILVATKFIIIEERDTKAEMMRI
jgi:hypothetical protein